MPLPLQRTSLREAREALARDGTLTLRGSIATNLIVSLGALFLLVGAGLRGCGGQCRSGRGVEPGHAGHSAVPSPGAALFAFGTVLWAGRLAHVLRALVVEEQGMRIDGSALIPWTEIRGFDQESHRLGSSVTVEMTEGAYGRVRPSLAMPFRWLPYRRTGQLRRIPVQRIPGLSTWALQQVLETAWLQHRS